MELTDSLRTAFYAALSEAEKFMGATAPNPPVGAAALDRDGLLLGVAAHTQAGLAHAEAKLLRELDERGLTSRIHTLVVTLEPCNHFGKTPPCTEAILKHPSIQTVWIGCLDPNPHVAGGGSQHLIQRGLQVFHAEPSSDIAQRCRKLIEPFRYWSKNRIPYITLKTAHLLADEASRRAAFKNRTQLLGDLAFLRGSMIPPQGQKTFTDPDSLTKAHLLRRRADAILTGVGTLLADQPLFTVRHVNDFPEKKRTLLVLDRQLRTPESWLKRASNLGFQVELIRSDSALNEALVKLGERGAHELLVEAGPQVSFFMRHRSAIQRHISIWHTPTQPDLFQEDQLHS